MANENPQPIRARRWVRPPAQRRRTRSSRLLLRLVAIPAAAVAGVLIFTAIRDRLTLPDCDSGRAKHTLADVLKALKLEPTRYEPVRTISSSKEQVVCSALLPLPDGASVVADYTFYWQGQTAAMKYSVARQAP